MRKNVLISLLAVLTILFAQASSATALAENVLVQKEYPIFDEGMQTQVIDNNPLVSQGVSDLEWQEIEEEIGSDNRSTYFKASNTDAGDLFGGSVAISGNTIVIGACEESSNATGVNGNERDNSAYSAGAAYVFVRDSQGNWSQQAYLKASNTEANDHFGASVAISGDTIVIGAPWEDSNARGVNGDQSNNSARDAGAAYVFERDGQGNWSPKAYLKASTTNSGDWFGESVAISGNTIVVGAPGEDVGMTGVNSDQGNNIARVGEAAYVFVRDSQGNWNPQASLQASNSDAWDFFGRSVAISGDTIVVGAIGEDSRATGVNGNQQDNSASNAGAAYAFVRDIQGSWSQQAYLKASNTDAGDSFGGSVSISGDVIVVGAYGEDSNATNVNGDQNNNSATGAGAAYVFMRDSQGNWSYQAYLKASNTDAGDSFGGSVSISGGTIVVGALAEDSSATGANGDQSDNSAKNAGAAYVFTRDSQLSWKPEAYLKASNTDAGDWYGNTVAISGDTIVVGALYEDSSAKGVNGDQNNNDAGGAGAAYAIKYVGFRPYPDGYSFKNYCDDIITSLMISDLRYMFGDKKVCQEVIGDYCSPKMQAYAWLIKQRKSTCFRCHGMSVSSLRFYAGSDFLPDHKSVFDLKKEDNVIRLWNSKSATISVRKNIAFFHVFQYMDPVKEYSFNSIDNDSVPEILQKIISALYGPKPEYLNLSICKPSCLENNNVVNKGVDKGGGHTITPYKVIDKGDGIFWVYVYDSNTPNDFDRKLIINTINETWEYDMRGGFGVWQGDSTTKAMFVVPLSAYALQPKCPWCKFFGMNETPEQQVYFHGSGELLVRDSQNRRLGYENGIFFSEIPGAYVTVVLGGEGPMIYSLPLTDNYTMKLTGTQEKQFGEASIAGFGPDYAVNLENIYVDSSTNDTIIFSNDGNSISYSPSQNQAATLASAVDTANGSWHLEVNGMPLTISQQNSLTVNTTSESFTLNANNDSAEYDIYIMRSSSDGLEMYVHGAVPKNSGETHTIRFGVFKDQNIVILDIDRDGDGVVDESIPLENQVKNLYLPLVYKK